MMLQDMKILIDDFIAKKGWTIHTLSVKSGVGYSTLRSYYALKGNPKWSTVSEILDLIATPSIKYEFMKNHFPKQAKYFNPRTRLENEKPREPSQIKNFIHREPHNKIFNMALTDAGISLEIVKDIAGKMGVNAANDLVEAGLIKKVGEKYFAEKCFYSVDETISQMKNHMGYFNEKYLGTLSRLMWNSDSFSPKGIEKLQGIISKFIESYFDLREDEELAGEIQVFLSLMSSPYRDFDDDESE